MKCYKHPSQDAVVACQCGRGLCSECSSYYYLTTPEGLKKVICEECYNDMHGQDTKQAGRDYVRYLIASIWGVVWCIISIILYIGNSMHEDGAPLLALFFCGLIGGIGIGIVIPRARQRSLEETIAIGGAWGRGDGGQMLAVIFWRFIAIVIASTFALPLVCLYTIYKTVKANNDKE